MQQDMKELLQQRAAIESIMMILNNATIAICLAEDAVLAKKFAEHLEKTVDEAISSIIIGEKNEAKNGENK